MFNFLLDASNYEERKIDRHESEKLIIDTAEVSDGNMPYETAVAHDEYNEGKWVIVEAYETREDAQIGHDKWVILMTSEKLPDVLKDCQNAQIAQLYDAVGGVLEFPRKISV